MPRAADKGIVATLKMTPKKVSHWRKRFLTSGMVGLEHTAPRPRLNAQNHRQRGAACGEPDNAPETTQRHLLEHAHHGLHGGHQWASVRRIWRSHGLKPHRVESFNASNDPEVAEKLEDIVGLYLNLPEHALGLCVDEHP
jgi:hypothetical protein